MECRWYREGNAARRVAGARRAWVLPLADGTALALLPAELPDEECEAWFESLLLQHWCARYGLPEARARLRDHLRDREAG